MIKCWNCNSDCFYQNDITEYCTRCNIRCWYNNIGGNKEYHDALDKRNARYEEKRKAELKKQFEEEWGISFS